MKSDLPGGPSYYLCRKRRLRNLRRLWNQQGQTKIYGNKYVKIFSEDPRIQPVLLAVIKRRRHPRIVNDMLTSDFSTHVFYVFVLRFTPNHTLLKCVCRDER